VIGQRKGTIMQHGKSYYALAVFDQKLGEHLLELNPALTRPQLSKAKLEFKRLIGNQKFSTQKQAIAAWKKLPVDQACFVYATELTPIYGIL
jgi:hypothetical protein